MIRSFWLNSEDPLPHARPQQGQGHINGLLGIEVIVQAWIHLHELHTAKLACGTQVLANKVPLSEGQPPSDSRACARCKEWIQGVYS